MNIMLGEKVNKKQEKISYVLGYNLLMPLDENLLPSTTA